MSKRIYVKVITRSSQSKIEKLSEGEYKAWLNSPPLGGRANEELIQRLADFFRVAKSQVSIVGGKTSSRKMVDILV